MERHFHNVLIFSMNDEVVHTGFYPMAHYFVRRPAPGRNRLDDPASSIRNRYGWPGRRRAIRRLRNGRRTRRGTTRRRENLGEHCHYLDLADHADQWKCPWLVSCRDPVCAGITKAQACKDDPLLTAATNVQGISAVVSNLVAAGAFVIFLSTNQVFEWFPRLARSPMPSFPPVNRIWPPKGRGRAAIGLSMATPSHCPLRQDTRPQTSLITGWIDSLRSGKADPPIFRHDAGAHSLGLARSPC